MQFLRYAALLLVLTGCATPEQWAEEVKAAYGPYCDALGFQRETDQWRQCVQFEDAKRAAAAQNMLLMSQPGWWGCRRGRYC